MRMQKAMPLVTFRWILGAGCPSCLFLNLRNDDSFQLNDRADTLLRAYTQRRTLYCSDPPRSTYISSVHSSVTRQITSFDDYNLTRNTGLGERRSKRRNTTKAAFDPTDIVTYQRCVMKREKCRPFFSSFRLRKNRRDRRKIGQTR